MRGREPLTVNREPVALCVRIVAALLLCASGAAAQYCAPAAVLREIFGSGVSIGGAVATTTTTREVLYTLVSAPQFGPMEITCGQQAHSDAASGSIMCGRMKPNTAYYIHPSYDGSSHRDCQTETVAFDCNSVPNFATAGAGEAACEIETDADGTNEVIKIRTPATGDAPEAPDAPTYTRTWNEGYTQTPDASATVGTTTSGGEELATNFLAAVTAAAAHLQANPTETYTVTIPPGTRVRRENEGGVGASPNVQGFEIPACDGDETGMLIIESSTPDPDAMPPQGATPTGAEEWAFIEWNRNGVLTNTSDSVLTWAEPACPTTFRGVTFGAPPHELKERWVATGTAAVTPGSPRENDSTLLDFTGSTPDVSDAWPTTANAGVTVVGLKGDVFHNGTDAETGVASATQFTRSADTITISGKAALGSPVVWSEMIAAGGRVSVNPVTGQLAFDKLVGSFFEVHLADADGSNVTCLSCDRGDLPTRHIGNPVWSPDGEWLVMQGQKSVATTADAFASPGLGMFNDGYAYEVDTDTAYLIHSVAYTTPATGLLHFQFNHAGDKLMWAEMTDATGGFNGSWKIVIADWDAGAHTLSNLTDYTPSSKTFFETHGWNDDDSLIVYSAAASAFTDLDIWTWDLSGSPTNLTDDVAGAWDEHAHFTRDGTQIAWMSSRGQSFSPLETDFWIMDADGTDKRRLTNFSDDEAPEYQGYTAIAADFDWSLDDSRIIGYVQENDGAGYDSGRLLSVNRSGAARLHNIISLPFTSAAGALLTTPAHPYVDSPTTDIVSFVDGVVTTSASHGASYLSLGNTIWLQGTDNGAGGDCDGFYGNVSGGTPSSDNGRDTTTMSLQAIDGSTGTSIPDCNTANGTVQIVGVAMLASDSYPKGIACYVSFPSSTQVRLELCTETGPTTMTPDLTGETGYVSYDPPTLPPVIVHPGGAPLHMQNVTIRADRPWRIERAIQLNDDGSGAGTFLVGVRAEIGLWLPSPPNPYAAGAMAMTKVSGFEFPMLVRCFGCSDLVMGPGWREGGGFTWFGNEFLRPTPTDITLQRWADVFPNWAVSGESSIVEPVRQLFEGKGGIDGLDWVGNISIGMPEHNTPVAVPFTCKTNGNNYNSDPVLTSTCSNFNFRKSFWSAPQFLKTGVTEQGSNATAKFEWLTYRKVAIEDNVIRMRARKGFLYGEYMHFAGYSNSSFMTLGPSIRATTDVAVRRNLWLPNLGDSNGAGGEWNVLLDPLALLGSRFEWAQNIHIDNVKNNTAGGRFGGTWANQVEAMWIADGAFSTLADISDNPVAYCFDDTTTNPDYTTLVTDACTDGATYWGATGYADAFDPVACNPSESCKTRAEIILDTDTNEVQPAYAGYGPAGGMAGVLDAMGFILDVVAERLADGTAARLTYHVPDSGSACKTDWATPETDMDAATSGVSSVTDTPGSQMRQVLLEGLTTGVTYAYRVRCEQAGTLARGTL